MAARKPKTKMKEAMVWTKPAPGKSSKTLVPGVDFNEKGNLRPRMKGGKVKEVKAAVPVVQPEEEVEEEEEDDDEEEGSCYNSKTGVSVANSEVTQSAFETDASTVTTTIHDGKKVSLRDLCVEDKKRVANLIKELAKLGEEKESAERNLEDERRRYEDQILQLVDQQEEILKEREEVQRRMLEYQSMILKMKQQQQRVEHHRQAAMAPTPAQASPGHGIKVGQGQRITEEPGRGSDERAVRAAEDQPSRHVYLNDLDNSETLNDDNTNIDSRGWAGQGGELEDFSTQVQPPHSPRLGQRGGVKDDIPNQPCRDRPFTALIDRELENQKRALATVLNNSGGRLGASQSEVDHYRQRHRLQEQQIQHLQQQQQQQHQQQHQQQQHQEQQHHHQHQQHYDHQERGTVFSPPSKNGRNRLSAESVNRLSREVPSPGLNQRIYPGPPGVSSPSAPALPPRPSPPSHEKQKLVDGNNGERSEEVKGWSGWKESGQGWGYRYSGKENHRDDEQKPKSRRSDEHLPQGNLALLTPEKNELLSRFMQGQSEIGGLVRESPRNLESGGDVGLPGKKKKRDMDAPGRMLEFGADAERGREDRARWCENQPVDKEWQDGFVVSEIHAAEKEKMEGGFTLTQQPHYHQQQQQQHHHREHREKNHRSRANRKRRKPPPPSYGPLHPPVMSSTQKSSEFADFVSVASTELSTGATSHRQATNNYQTASKGDELRTERQQPGGQVRGQNGKEIKDVADHGSKTKTSNGYAEQEHRSPAKSVEFTDKPYETPRQSAVVDEDDFLEKYRKMSPSERKRELLRQKSLLLEEQTKLKKVLAGQEQQLQLKQQEAATRIEQFHGMKRADKAEREEMQQSLLRLESELARKEQELIQGRELLRQKRQAQSRLQTEADKASLEQKSGQRIKPQASTKDVVLSSTPKEAEHRRDLAGSQGDVLGQTPQERPGEAERELSGKDGDGCVLYASSSGGSKEGVVRKLDYSDNDDENDEAVCTRSPDNKVGQKAVAVATGRSATDGGDGNVAAAEADTPEERGVDAATSISYLHLSREKPSLEPTRTPSPRKDDKSGRKKSSRHSISPGEKTLSVLEIINSLNDDILPPHPGNSSKQGRTIGQVFTKQSGRVQTGNNSNRNTSSSSSSVWSRGFLGQFGNATKQPAVKGVGVGQGFATAQAVSLTPPYRDARPGCSLGPEVYPAMQTVPGMTASKFGHNQKNPRSEKWSELLAGGGRSGGAGSGGGAKPRGTSAAVLDERDENLAVFELKRNRLERGGAKINPTVHQGVVNDKNGNDGDDDDDVIDLILASRHGAGGDGSGVVGGGGVDVDEGTDIDLSAMCDDDVDSNLDDLVYALEEEEEGWSEGDVAEEDATRNVRKRLKDRKFRRERVERKLAHELREVEGEEGSGEDQEEEEGINSISSKRDKDRKFMRVDIDCKSADKLEEDGNDFGEDGLLAMVLKAMDDSDGTLGDENENDDDNDDIDDLYDNLKAQDFDDESLTDGDNGVVHSRNVKNGHFDDVNDEYNDNEVEDLEESQILEEVFFVQ